MQRRLYFPLFALMTQLFIDMACSDPRYCAFLGTRKVVSLLSTVRSPPGVIRALLNLIYESLYVLYLE